MPFSQYSTLEKSLKAFRISCSWEPFVVPATVEVSINLRAEIDFVQKFIGLPRTEAARRECLIYPILKETWKRFPQLQLWSGVSLEYDADLTGTPDYFLARQSPLGRMVTDEPYLIVMGTKKDDFDWGWGQCLAGMVTARKLNNRPEQVLFGIVTNGEMWEFGKLVADHLTEDPRPCSRFRLEQVCSAVHFMFEQCRLQLANYTGAA
jgi:hypothetical protein